MLPGTLDPVCPHLFRPKSYRLSTLDVNHVRKYTRPSPLFLASSDEKLSVGLGTRLGSCDNSPNTWGPCWSRGSGETQPCVLERGGNGNTASRVSFEGETLASFPGPIFCMGPGNEARGDIPPLVESLLHHATTSPPPTIF